jgi:cell division protein FtsB
MASQPCNDPPNAENKAQDERQMGNKSTRSGLGTAAYFAVIFALATYFTFAAVQGDYGLFRRVQIDAEASELRKTLETLQTDVATYSNKARRLSDDYLDLDLLDEQARSVLGMLRTDELVIR